MNCLDKFIDVYLYYKGHYFFYIYDTWYPPKKFPPKKFPAIKFPKMTTWDKKFPAKKFPPKSLFFNLAAS